MVVLDDAVKLGRIGGVSLPMPARRLRLARRQQVPIWPSLSPADERRANLKSKNPGFGRQISECAWV